MFFLLTWKLPGMAAASNGTFRTYLGNLRQTEFIFFTLGNLVWSDHSINVIPRHVYGCGEFCLLRTWKPTAPFYCTSLASEKACGQDEGFFLLLVHHSPEIVTLHFLSHQGEDILALALKAWVERNKISGRIVNSDQLCRNLFFFYAAKKGKKSGKKYFCKCTCLALSSYCLWATKSDKTEKEKLLC